MTDKAPLKKVLKDGIEEAIRRGPVNKAAAINIGEGSTHTGVSTRQTITHKDGKTTVTEIREEHRGEVGGGEDR